MKIHFFLDRRSILCLLCLLFSSGIAWVCLTVDELFYGIFFIIISVCLLLALLMLPCFYVMTEKGIKIFYFFFLSNEYCLWENVDEVKACYHTARTTALSPLFYTFLIDGKFEGKKRFYKEGQIIRTVRAGRLIEKYTGKKITGFYMDDFKAWVKKHRRESERRKTHRARMKQARDAQRKKARCKEMKNKQKGNRHE